MWGLVFLYVVLVVTVAQATPYQRKYNTSVATSATPLNPPPGSGCSGCVIQAQAPLTWAFAEAESSSWTSVVQTVTHLVKAISYFTGTPAALQTVVTETEALTQIETLTDASHETITYTTPVFKVEPTLGVTLELPAGTYLFYDKIYGGLNAIATATTKITEPVTYHPAPTAPGHAGVLLQNSGAQSTCVVALESLQDIKPTRTEDWRYFFQSATGTVALLGATAAAPVPSVLLNYLNSDPNIRSAFHGIDLNSCTPITTPGLSAAPIQLTSQPAFPGISTVAGVSSDWFGSAPVETTGKATKTQDQSTYIRTTYQTTSTHLTVSGCLRCDTSLRAPPLQTRIQNTAGGVHHGPLNTAKSNGQQPGVGQVISIGTKTFTIHPSKPSNQGHDSAPGQGVVVGTVTLAPGATTIINDVVIAVPSAGRGSIVVVGTNSYQVLSTAPPVISVGDATLTPTPQGHYVVGTHTLSPGGPAITANGYTLSLAWDGGRAVVNGVTQTLGHSPYTSGVPVLTVGERIISATLVDGIPEFVIGPGQTLLPGSALTISGTMYSMPSDASGTVVVINGVTSTLGLSPLTAAPDVTIAGSTYAATVRDGTTEYVLGPGTTLRPGDVVTVSGTVYSLDALGMALVVNGVTSTIAKAPASNSARPTSSASVAAPQGGGKFVETAAGTSSKGCGVPARRAGLDVWAESLIMGLASWVVMFL